MNSRLIISLILVIMFGLTRATEHSVHPATTSEMYINGFKEKFNALSSTQKDAMVKSINDLGEKFETIADSADYYIKQRDKRVAALRARKINNPVEKYALNRELIEEYIHFSFDSAFAVGKRNLDLASAMNDANKIAESKIDLANIFIQGGYFREAAQNIESICQDSIDDNIKIKALMTQFNMEFENGFFFAWNLQAHDVAKERMEALYPQILVMLPDDAYEIYQLKTILSFYKHQYVDATGYCDILLLKNNNPENWNYIKALGDMGYNKLGAHDYVTAMDYMVHSATLAIKRGALNNPALRKIAELLFIVGNTELASKLINLSMDNAMEYNSKYRIIESAKGYPMINRQLHSQIEKDQKTMSVIAVIMAVMIGALAITLWYNRKQHKKVKNQAQIISQCNDELKERNNEIESVNSKLSEIHGVTAVLASKMMNGASIRRELVDKMAKDVALKIKVKQYNDIPDVIASFQKELKKQRMDIDEILLAFFPDFVEQFNLLLKEDARYNCEKGTIPTEVRIFALWRIGLKKNDDIARCMDYSLNTIKSYKTRILNASLYEKEEFYDRLMQIKVNV